MKAKNAATGEIRDVSVAEAASLYKQGGWALEKGASIPMRTAHGNLVAVRPEDIGTADSEGFTLASEQEWAAADREARYGTGSQMALTAAEGAASGLTLGTYGAIADTIDPEYAREYAIRREVNPVSSVTGEVAGMVAPLLLSGGASAEASGASLLARGARGATALPRLAARGGLLAEEAAARALGEGATAGGRILRAMAAKGVGGAAETLPYAIGRGISTAALDHDASAERILAQIGLETMAGGLAGGILGGAGKAASEGYEAAAKRLFGDAAHPELGEAIVKLSAKLSGEDATTLRRLAIGDAGGGVLSESARANRALGFFEGDAIRTKAAKDISEGMTAAREAVEAAQRKAPPTNDVVEAMGRFANAQKRLENTSNILRDPEAAARHVDALLDPRDSTQSALRAWADAADDIAKTPEVAAFRKTLDEVEDKVVLANQTRALRQSIEADSGAGMLGVGLSFAMDSFAPVGVMSAISGAKKAVATAQTPGMVLKKLANIERIVSQATKRIDSGVDSYVAGLASKTAKTAASAAPKITRATARSLYERTYERLEAARANPEAAQAAIARSMAPAGSPKATAAMVARIERTNAFLASKMPKKIPTSNPWRTREPSDADVMKFARYAKAAEDPIGAITAELKSGSITRETMETVRAVAPSIADQVTSRVVESLTERKSPPDYGHLISLSILLGTPLDPSLEPGRIAQIQESYQYSDQGNAPTKPEATTTKIAESYASTLDRLTV